MSSMDSELCWGERSQNDEHDCGPDSGMVLPKVYSLDPAQVLALQLFDSRRPSTCCTQQSCHVRNLFDIFFVLRVSTINFGTNGSILTAVETFPGSFQLLEVQLRAFLAQIENIVWTHQELSLPSSLTCAVTAIFLKTDFSSSRARPSDSRQSSSALGKAAATLSTNGLRTKCR